MQTQHAKKYGEFCTAVTKARETFFKKPTIFEKTKRIQSHTFKVSKPIVKRIIGDILLVNEHSTALSIFAKEPEHYLFIVPNMLRVNAIIGFTSDGPSFRQTTSAFQRTNGKCGL